jgi:hypothetical protein
VTAVTASTPPADAVALTKRHTPHRARGVLALAAVGGVVLLWLALEVPGLKLLVPGIASDKTETPVVADLVVERGNADAHSHVAAATATHTRHPRLGRSSTRSTTAIAVSAPKATAAPAPRTPAGPTARPAQIRVQSAPPPGVPASPPPAPVAPPAQLPIAAPPTVNQVVTTAVSTVTTAAPTTSDVTAAVQQVTSTLPDAPTLQP